ncbi:SDR family oxidoreductase [bacterium]|nr:SDR family oxidoreductase [Akkermansiaceae bacterium]MDB4274245.1 SDR family oxidoreductase [Akkermansiaceae bacterium]MDB4284694.1 SDR family oxidoreductase [bacterium]MDB4569667.1 SDR family oxidoreductase [Akkermansiaceae bacterium]
MIIWMTGCTNGLGRALVPEFVERGHTVVGCGRNEIELQRLSEEFPDCFFMACDVSDEGSVEDFVNEALISAGEPDFLINNAAIVNEPAPLWQVSAEEFNSLTSVNINGVANMIRHVVPLMLSNDSGMVINLSSGWGRSSSPDVAPYCATKWAIEGLNQALSQELPENVGTVALNPGVINTEMLQKCWGEEADSFPSAESWATTAAPFILGLTPKDNGKPLTAP